MPNSMIDLAIRTPVRTVVRVVGYVALGAFGVVCVADLLVGREEWPVRVIAGVIGSAILLLMYGAWRVRDSRPRWLGIDHEGVRLVNRRGRDLTRLAWGDLAGLGLMTDEAARRRHLFAASIRPLPAIQRRAVSVIVWLELYPAGPDAVRRHPELRNAWRMGAARRDGQEHRWLLVLTDGTTQLADIGEHVCRWRPDLWRGHRAGSLLRG